MLNMSGDPAQQPPSLTEPSTSDPIVGSGSTVSQAPPVVAGVPATPVAAGSVPPAVPVNAVTATPPPTTTPVTPAQDAMIAQEVQSLYRPEVTGVSMAGEDLRQTPLPNQSNASDGISWTTGSEVVRGRSSNWTIRMTGLSVLVGAVIFLITRDWISSAAVLFAGFVFGLMGSRPPVGIEYIIDPEGISIGRKVYYYKDFRAFSVVQDSHGVVAELIPLKRFMPAVSMHLDRTRQQEILAVLSGYLPMQPHKQDMVDYIVGRIKL
jgi:hypothetical protein